MAGDETSRLDNGAPDARVGVLYTLHTLGLRDAPRPPTTTPDSLGRDGLRYTVTLEEAASVTCFRGPLVASPRLTLSGHEVGSEPTVTHPAHHDRWPATTLKAQAPAWVKATPMREPAAQS